MTVNGVPIALVNGEGKVITDRSSALELIAELRSGMGVSRLAVDKKLIAEDFFVLSTGLAGEILQRFINYQVKIAIYGDFSIYTSKPLADFLYESNKGEDVFFVADKEEALRRLAEAI